MTELATMEFHPQPQAGEARPWAFPAPERGTLGNGLTVLRCHRPGQQVVAVEVLLDAPLEAEPAGLDGVATIMARAFSEGTDKHSAEEFAAELERCGATLDAHADHPGVRLSLEVPASRLAKALGLLADALRAPAFADSEVERLVRNRLDEIPHELANPSRRAAKELSKELFPATSRMSRPRQGTEETVEKIDSAAVRAFYDRHVRPATATAVVVGDLTGIDLDALLGDTLGAWTGSTAEPRPVPPVTADDTGRVVIVDRPGAVQTQLLIGRVGADRHDRVWPAQVLGTYCLGGTLTSRLDRVLREEKGYTYGVRAFGQVLRSAPDGSGAAMLAISGSVDTPNTGPALRRPVEGAAHARRRGTHRRRARRRRAEPRRGGAAEVRDRGGRGEHAGRPGRAAPAGRLPGDAVPAARRDRHRGGHRGGRERLPGGPSGDRPGRRRGRRSRSPSRPSGSAKSPSWQPSRGPAAPRAWGPW